MTRLSALHFLRASELRQALMRVRDNLTQVNQFQRTTAYISQVLNEDEERWRQAAKLKTTQSAAMQKGGFARAEKLTPERRVEIARKAALARWAKKKKR